MNISYYLPAGDAARLALMEHVAERLVIYAVILGISAEEIAALKADILAMRYVIYMSNKIHALAKTWTAYGAALRDGNGNGGSIDFPPESVSETPAPPPVAMGAISRFTALITHAKSSPNYTDAIGQDMKIVGTQRIIDTSSWQPVLDIRRDGGHPVLVWTKGDADSLEVWVARSPQAEFTLLDITTKPHYLDNAPLPTVATTWRYKAIYRLHSEQVGDWSSVVTTLVGS